MKTQTGNYQTQGSKMQGFTHCVLLETRIKILSWSNCNWVSDVPMNFPQLLSFIVIPAFFLSIYRNFERKGK